MRTLKTIITISLFLALQSNLFAQRSKKEPEAPQMPMDSTSMQITYREVVEVKGTKAELFARFTEWVQSHYKTSSVIKNAEEESGLVEVSSRVKIYGTAKDGTKIMSGLVNYNLTMELKDGRYRYTFTRFSLKAQAFQPIEPWLDQTKKEWFPARFDNLREVDEQIKEIIVSLKEGMEPKEVVKDDW
ncbi:MAG: DUF4468 domain-containing protein [Bacteroidales bacterium]|nr:DUF4468 domain-containing protein [Bacteroidales bacterium]